MKTRAILFFFLICSTLNGQVNEYYFHPGGNICPTNPWYLVLNDEFDGNSLDLNKWEIKERNWTNGNEIYKASNIEISNGTLKLKALSDFSIYNGKEYLYSAGGIEAKDVFSTSAFQRIEVECRIPAAPGFWPAAWAFNWGVEFDFMEAWTSKRELKYTTHRFPDVNNGFNYSCDETEVD